MLGQDGGAGLTRDGRTIPGEAPAACGRSYRGRWNAAAIEGAEAALMSGAVWVTCA